MPHSKYQRLHEFLRNREDRQLPLTFGEIERVLQFELPPSARRYPAWWSNNRGTNVAVKAWRDAGWRTTRVDLGAERLVFVKDDSASRGPEMNLRDRPSSASATLVDLSALSAGAERLLRDYCEQKACDESQAIVEILNGMALERRRLLVERFRSVSPRLRGDSADLIREERDAG